jgi:PPOX class probable F420-dependent enzyme
VSRRDQIKMTAEEADAFLEDQRTVICATNGRDGFPHLMPLWYVARSGRIWAWTYAKSQKTRNLERDPRATLQVETGDEYQDLRGLMLRCETTVHRDHDVIEAFAMELVDRYSGQGPEFDPVRDGFRAQVPKRVALEFVERSRVSWDHRKLAGTY